MDQPILSLIQIFQMMPKTVYIYIYIYTERSICQYGSDHILLIRNQNSQKNIGKQNSEIPCDED